MQNKPEQMERLRALLPAATVFVTPARRRTFPTGRTYDTRPVSQFLIPAQVVRGLLLKAGVATDSDLPRLVTRLTVEARRAMLAAMLDAEADARGVFAQKRDGVREAMQILATLEGLALGKQSVIRTGDYEYPVQRVKRRRLVSASQLILKALGPRPAWCPTTDHGTWVMRQDGNVTITGNTKSLGRALEIVLKADTFGYATR